MADVRGPHEVEPFHCHRCGNCRIMSYDARMFSRSWLAQVVGGSLVGGLFGVFTVIIAMEALAHSARPVELGVLEAMAQIDASGRIEHMRFADLTMHCDSRELMNGKIYVGAGRAGAEPGPLVIVELERSDDCEDGPMRSPGSLERPALRLEYELSVAGRPQVMLFRPHDDSSVALVVCSVLAIGGGALVWRGLRRRRSERELLDRAMAEAPVLAPENGQADPYRQEQGRRWLLPGPLRPDEGGLRRARRRALAGGVLGAVMLALGLLWAGSFTRDAIRMHTVWGSGALATEPDAGGHDRGRARLVNLADLVVVYADAAGKRHHGTYSRLALVSGIDDTTPPMVKYDRDDPSSFALSWVVEAFWGEAALILAMLALVLPGSWFMLRAPRRRLRELQEIRETLHSSPEEVVLTVLYAQRREVKGELMATEYGLRTPDGVTLSETFVAGENPLFLELDESRALGLRRGAHVVVLRDDLSPLAPDEQEAERVRLRWRRGQGQRPT